MRCRNCGTEIAEKALICFRCGAATTDPVVAPAARPRGPSLAGLATTLALVLLVLAALFLGRTQSAAASAYVRWAVVAVAVLIVVLRAYARRRPVR